MMCWLTGIRMGWNRKKLKSELTEIRIRNRNQIKLFILTVQIRIKMSWIAIDVFTLSWNQNWDELDCYKLIKSS